MKRSLLVTALLFVGCTPAPDDDDEPPDTSVVAPAVATLTRAQCEKMFECCGAGELESLFAGEVTDVETCISALDTQAQAFLVPALEEAVSNETATVSSEAAGACAEALPAADCSDFRPATSLTLLEGSCADVVEPRLTLSGFCSDDFQCDTRFCSVPPGEVEGSCKNPPVEGEACLNDRCAPGFYCAADGTCAPLLDDGEACARSADCASGDCAANGAGMMACTAVEPICR